LVPARRPGCKDISSLIILEKAAELIREAGHELVNLDSTVVAEAPKILPHRDAMRAAIGAATGLPPERVGIKATTNERMGFVGREEGIAAIATASLLKQR
jgi:2-C-methyl-D-erythritol 2,4-cyclodiphosphate synthase